MANPEKLPLHSQQVPTGTSGPDSPKNDTESARTDTNKKATLEPDHKPSGLDNHIHSGVAGTLLEEDPFSSEASKVLFDGMDDLRRCGAAVDLDLPQVTYLTPLSNMP
jgi:hypothetical protein